MRSGKSELKRVLGLGALFIYGLGDILGAGIYAVVGKIAGVAGHLAWLSFLVALAVVLLTALSYAELGSRYPKSGGSSVYVDEAFGRKWLSTLAGWLLFCASILSMATLSRAFVGYLKSFGFDFIAWYAVAAFLLVLMFINFRGMKHSSWANMLSTTVEVSGLLIVLGLGFWYLSGQQAPIAVTVPSSGSDMMGVFQGAALAFFAFTGFEDLANIAEEVKEPKRNLPRAILGSLFAAALLYVLVAGLATSVITPEQLGKSDSPLLDVVNKAYPSFPGFVFTVIAIFAVSNTTLLNYITASRLLYGMAKKDLLPQALTKVHRKYSTPYVAILIILPLVFVLGIIGTLGGLAGSTSALVLTVFTLTNIALIQIGKKKRKEDSEEDVFKIPKFVPYLGVILNITAITFLPRKDLLPAAIFIVVGFAVSILMAKFQRSKSAET